MDGGRTPPYAGLEGGVGIGNSVLNALGAGSVNAVQLTCEQTPRVGCPRLTCRYANQSRDFLSRQT
jgi:hypothetical protein